MHRAVTVGLLVLAGVCGGLIYLLGALAETPDAARLAHAMAQMVSGLILLWIYGAGAAMYRWRDAVRAAVRAIPLDPRVVFVGFAVLLACLEEVVTVSMTNLAPLFGARVGEAYITASDSYFDVILFHSVVVFVPYFIVLALILSHWDFSPFAVFLSFGVVGTVGEAIFAGNLLALLMFPVWVFVYGLMVWLPAYCLPWRQRRPVGWLGNLLLAPAIFVLAMPMIAAVVYVISGVLGHPGIDFPAME